MLFLLTIPLLFCMNIFPMLPLTPYGPAYTQAHNTELKKWRTLFNEAKTTEQLTILIHSNKNIVHLKGVPADLTQKCFQYAMRTITGFDGFISFPGERGFTIKLEKYFQQSLYPKKNDLIIYTPNEKNRAMHHFAIAIDKTWFQSKWGNHAHIYKHLPFDVPEYYGDAAWSFELITKYQEDEGKKLLLEDIQNDMYNYEQLQLKARLLTNTPR